jgi:hypothetical protein
MELIELVKIAHAAYEEALPESSLLAQVDGHGEPLSLDEWKQGFGTDLMARHIVTELFETFNDDDLDEDQFEAAARVLTRTRDDLDAVIAALEDAAVTCHTARDIEEV